MCESFYSGQFLQGAEAKKLLESVRDHDLVKQKKSRQAFIISACVCHVESVASHAFPDYFGSQNTLERLYERCRFLRAAVESSIGKKSWEWDKGKVVQTVLWGRTLG